MVQKEVQIFLRGPTPGFLESKAQYSTPAKHG